MGVYYVEAAVLKKHILNYQEAQCTLSLQVNRAVEELCQPRTQQL